MPRNVAATVLLAAGAWAELGIGPALLLLGVLLYVGVPSEAQAREAGHWALKMTVAAWTAISMVPRRALAATGMVAALALIPSGMALLSGLGAGLVAGGAMLAGLSLVLGWNS